jgi:superfamily I DNA/RNA helicase
MGWMVPEERLGDDQKEIIEEISKIGEKPIWIKGNAGSGKSVVLIQSVKDYLANHPNATVCIVVFTRALLDMISNGIKQVPQLRDKKLPVYTIYQLYPKIMNGQKFPFDAIFCDEVQDLPITFISSMKNACHHLILAGDASQSIYTDVPNFITPSASVEEIKSIIAPQEKNLNVIYRLSKNILGMLRNVFPQLLDDLVHVNKENTQIKLFQADTFEKEVAFTWKDATATKLRRPEDSTAILISLRESIATFVNQILTIENKPIWLKELDQNGELNFGSMNRHLEEQNIPLMYLGNTHGSLSKADNDNKIIIMTYHSSKGLDFNYVYLPLINQEMYIHENINELLLVALSRSKGGLTLTFNGALYSPLVPFLSTVPIVPLPNNENVSNTKKKINI